MYRRKSLRIGLASGSGAFTGALMSLQIAGYFGGNIPFWLCGFLGMFAGGIFAYFAYNFGGFYRSAGEAWRFVARTDVHIKSRLKCFAKTWTGVVILEIFLSFWMLLWLCLLGFIIQRQTPLV